MSSLQAGEVVSALRKRRNTAQSVDLASPHSCNHAFEITDRVGVCAICKKKVGSVRNLGYQCQHCGLLVDKNCIAKAFGKVKSRKDSAPRQLVFLEHLRLGTVDIVLSTKGMALLNVKNFSIILQHQIYSDKLTTWGEVIRHIRKAYTSEIIRSAPNILKGWGFRRSGQVDMTEKKKEKLQKENVKEMTKEMKEALLLGIHSCSVSSTNTQRQLLRGDERMLAQLAHAPSPLHVLLQAADDEILALGRHGGLRRELNIGDVQNDVLAEDGLL